MTQIKCKDCGWSIDIPDIGSSGCPSVIEVTKCRQCGSMNLESYDYLPAVSVRCPGCDLVFSIHENRDEPDHDEIHPPIHPNGFLTCPNCKRSAPKPKISREDLQPGCRRMRVKCDICGYIFFEGEASEAYGRGLVVLI